MQLKILLSFICLLLMAGIRPMDDRGVLNDFGKTFDRSRFGEKLLIIREDHQQKIFDSSIVLTDKLKKNTWSKINRVIGRCDYIVNKDSTKVNCFFIWSDKALRKFWIEYTDNDKIAVIKIITPKVTVHFIPPPCGY
jgi:hypothetical protein